MNSPLLKSKIRLLIVDDQSVIREGLGSLMRAKPDFEVVGEAENGTIALELARSLLPDVILMDIRMPVMDGVFATKRIAEELPQIKVLVLTTFDNDEYVVQAIQNGAKGYLLKDTPSEEIAQAIRSVQKGYTQFGPGIFEKILTPTEPPGSDEFAKVVAQLTPREGEVLGLIAAGYSNREIAQALYITERTVKNHVSSILSRLNLRDRTQAALYLRKIN